MSIEKFLRRNQMIAAHLKELATHREEMQWDGILHPVNPQFREMMQAQERLLNAVERVLDNLPSRAAA